MREHGCGEPLLTLCYRSVWHYPLRLDNKLYIEVVFNQIAPDYLEGLLLVMPSEQIDQDIVYQVAKVAALLHKAADMDHVPTLKVRDDSNTFQI